MIQAGVISTASPRHISACQRRRANVRWPHSRMTCAPITSRRTCWTGCQSGLWNGRRLLLHESQDNAKRADDDISDDFVVSHFLDEANVLLKKCDLSLTCAQPCISHGQRCMTLADSRSRQATTRRSTYTDFTVAGASRELHGESVLPLLVFETNRRHGCDDVIIIEEAPDFLTVAEKVLQRMLGHIFKVDVKWCFGGLMVDDEEARVPAHDRLATDDSLPQGRAHWRRLILGASVVPCERNLHIASCAPSRP